MINKYKISREKIKIENLEEKIVSKEKDDEIKRELYEDLVPRLRGLHEKLFAESKQGILVVLQAIDAAGKDEIIKYIFSFISVHLLSIIPFRLSRFSTPD